MFFYNFFDIECNFVINIESYRVNIRNGCFFWTIKNILHFILEFISHVNIFLILKFSYYLYYYCITHYWKLLLSTLLFYAINHLWKQILMRYHCINILRSTVFSTTTIHRFVNNNPLNRHGTQRRISIFIVSIN